MVGRGTAAGTGGNQLLGFERHAGAAGLRAAGGAEDAVIAGQPLAVVGDGRALRTGLGIGGNGAQRKEQRN
jgi:hypothetical protein